VGGCGQNLRVSIGVKSSNERLSWFHPIHRDAIQLAPLQRHGAASSERAGPYWRGEAAVVAERRIVETAHLVAADLKPIYQASMVANAELRPGEFAAKWDASLSHHQPNVAA
jgi:hypothetical protein